MGASDEYEDTELDNSGSWPLLPGRHPPPHSNGSKKIIWAVACGLATINITALYAAGAWFNGKLWELQKQSTDMQRELQGQNTSLQLETTKQISNLTIEMTRAIGVAQQAVYRADIAERESRLAQEDLMMLRAAVRQHGIPTDGAGDH